MKSLVRLINMLVFCLLVITHNTAADDKAINFELPHLLNGNLTSLNEFKGKVVYVDFWASWCKPCKKSFPVLNEFHNKYQQQGFEVIAINLDEDKLNALEFLQQHTVDYSVLYDEGAKVAQSYKVQAMPSAYFIDKKGIVRLVHKGYMDSDKDKIKKVIELLISE